MLYVDLRNRMFRREGGSKKKDLEKNNIVLKCFKRECGNKAE